MTPRILDQTTNLVRLYTYHCGRTEVPDIFHLWSCLAMIAACVGDRVYYEKFRGSKLLPNLYVLLIGPSGLGKGTAIKIATRFVRKLSRVNLYQGKITAPYLVDYLGGNFHMNNNGKRIVENTKLFLVTPELSNSVGSGPLADGLVKMLTDLYEGDIANFQEGTRIHGGIQVREACINWLAGSTKDWLATSITKDAIEGGFFARTCAVEANYDLNYRVLEPSYPPDYEEVFEHIMQRVSVLTALQGVFHMDYDAKRIEEQWYVARETPEDDAMLPTWKRQHDLVLKLSMLLSLADNVTYTDESFVINLQHLKRAQLLANELMRFLPGFLSLAAQSKEMSDLVRVTNCIKKAGRIQRFVLMRMVSPRGTNREALDACLDQLLQERKITRGSIPSGGLVYTWVQRKTKLSEVKEDE